MEQTNIMLLLTPKSSLKVLYEDMSVRQGAETMKAHCFLAIPLISNQGEYLGTISYYDLFWTMTNYQNLEELERLKLKDILRKDYVPAMKVDTTIDTLINRVINQNFVPIVDDRNILMGIVTRRSVIGYLVRKEEEYASKCKECR